MPIAAPLAANHSSAAAGARTRVAVAGATGYAGQELVRLLARHPAVTLTAAMSSGATSAPRPLPALARIWDGTVAPLDVGRLATDADVVFLALPEAAAAEVAPALLERGVRVIDLSGAFRIRSDADRAALVSGHRRRFPTASSTGCRSCTQMRFATRGWCRVPAAIRPPRSWRSRRWRRRGCSKDRSSSTRSRASPAPARRRASGRTSPRTTAASPPTASSRTGIRRRSSRSWTAVTFVPHLVPLDRGILETIYVSLRPGTTEAQVSDGAAARHTRGAVRAADRRRRCRRSSTSRTRTSATSAGRWTRRRGRLVMVAVLDNLVKGAAGQAVQNLNIVLGLDERTGLL